VTDYLGPWERFDALLVNAYVAVLTARAKKAEANAARLAEALRRTLDEQNGPPLKRRAVEWCAATNEAREALAAHAALAAHDAGEKKEGGGT